ncbi:MAG TPA: ATP-binding protein [bacterium]
MRLSVKLFIWFALAAGVPSSLAGYLTYRASAEQLEDGVRARLSMLTDFRADQIEARVRVYLDDAERAAAAGDVWTAVLEPHDAPDPAQEPRPAVDGGVSDAHVHYADALLIDRQGVVQRTRRASQLDGVNLLRDADRQPELTALLHETARTGRAGFTLIADRPAALTPGAAVVAPIARDGAISGWLVLRPPVTDLEDFAKVPSGIGADGEIVIGTRTGREIVLIASGTPGIRSRAVPLGSGAVPALQEAVSGGSGAGRRPVAGERGVIAAWRPAAEGRLGVVTRMDVTAALAPVTSLRRWFLLVALVALSLMLVTAIIVARSIGSPVRALTERARAIARGEFGSQMPVRIRGEIGELTAAFNRMAGELADARARLEARAGELAQANADLERVNARLKEEIAARRQLDNERLHLASFPEDNPLPVVGLAPGKGLMYANPAAAALMPDAKPGEAAHPLLAGLEELAVRLRKDGERFHLREVEWDGRWYEQHVSLGSDGETHRVYMVDVTESRTFQRETARTAGVLTEANAELQRRERIMRSLLEDLTTSKDRLERQRASLEESNRGLARSHEELKTAQLALIESEKRESIGRLAAGVAHEVKNPLAIVLMGIEFLRGRMELVDETLRDVVDDMDGAVRRADAVIRGLLNFSASTTLEPAPADLNALIGQALLLVKHELVRAHVSMQTSLAEELPRLVLDHQKIEQAFVNLFLNAIQAMAGEGTLTVRTRALRGAGVASETESARDPQQQSDGEITGVAAEIEDTGPGVSEEQLRKIFDPFFTTKPMGQGTGLGLSVTKKIIELHQGSIGAVNLVPHGLRIVITFPVRSQQPAASGERPATSGQ